MRVQSLCEGRSQHGEIQTLVFMKQKSGHPKYKTVTPVVDLRRMTLEDKETGSDSSANKKNPKPDRGSEGSGVAQPLVNV